MCVCVCVCVREWVSEWVWEGERICATHTFSPRVWMDGWSFYCSFLLSPLFFKQLSFIQYYYLGSWIIWHCSVWYHVFYYEIMFYCRCFSACWLQHTHFGVLLKTNLYERITKYHTKLLKVFFKKKIILKKYFLHCDIRRRVLTSIKLYTSNLWFYIPQKIKHINASHNTTCSTWPCSMQ